MLLFSVVLVGCGHPLISDGRYTVQVLDLTSDCGLAQAYGAKLLCVYDGAEVADPAHCKAPRFDQPMTWDVRRFKDGAYIEVSPYGGVLQGHDFKDGVELQGQSQGEVVALWSGVLGEGPRAMPLMAQLSLQLMTESPWSCSAQVQAALQLER